MVRDSSLCERNHLFQAVSDEQMRRKFPLTKRKGANWRNCTLDYGVVFDTRACRRCLYHCNDSRTTTNPYPGTNLLPVNEGSGFTTHQFSLKPLHTNPSNLIGIPVGIIVGFCLLGLFLRILITMACGRRQRHQTAESVQAQQLNAAAKRLLATRRRELHRRQEIEGRRQEEECRCDLRRQKESLDENIIVCIRSSRTPVLNAYGSSTNHSDHLEPLPYDAGSYPPPAYEELVDVTQEPRKTYNLQNNAEEASQQENLARPSTYLSVV